jgi:hypothetical protein
MPALVERHRRDVRRCPRALGALRDRRRAEGRSVAATEHRLILACARDAVLDEVVAQNGRNRRATEPVPRRLLVLRAVRLA